MGKIAPTDDADGLILVLFCRQCRNKVALARGVLCHKPRQPLDYVDKSGFAKIMRQEAIFPLAGFRVSP